LRIRDENLKLQEQLNQAIKLQEKLKQQAIHLNKQVPPRLPHGKPGGKFGPPPFKGAPFDSGPVANSDGMYFNRKIVFKHLTNRKAC